MHVIKYFKQTMSKTPTKSESFFCYSTKELSSPYKDNSGVSKTIFTHVSNLHRLLSDWVKILDKGTKICKTISALGLHEFYEGYYPHQTKALSECLLEALNGLKNVVDGVEILKNQLRALAQLQPGDNPVIFTWSATKISEYVSKLYSNLQREYKLKEVITENIAHCRDENLMEVYVSSWQFDIYFKLESSEYLFAEIGLPVIA